MPKEGRTCTNKGRDESTNQVTLKNDAKSQRVRVHCRRREDFRYLLTRNVYV